MIFEVYLVLNEKKFILIGKKSLVGFCYLSNKIMGLSFKISGVFYSLKS